MFWDSFWIFLDFLQDQRVLGTDRTRFIERDRNNNLKESAKESEIEMKPIVNHKHNGATSELLLIIPFHNLWLSSSGNKTPEVGWMYIFGNLL